MTQASKPGSAFRGFRIPFAQERFGVVIHLTGGRPTFLADGYGAILWGQRVAVVIVPCGHAAGHHAVCRTNIPDTLLTVITGA